jgi:hypothetical protein
MLVDLLIEADYVRIDDAGLLVSLNRRYAVPGAGKHAITCSIEIGWPPPGTTHGKREIKDNKKDSQ